MSIDDITSSKLVTLDLEVSDRWEAIEALADLLDRDGRLTDKELYVGAVKTREEETGGTAMERG